MNKIQEAYALAKARLQVVKEQHDENEAVFIKNSGYVNEDGTTPEHFWMMDDEKKFEELSTAFEATSGNLFYKVRAAEISLKEAEDALIDFGLSFTPVDVREALSRNRNHWKFREKMINLAFRLDTTTIEKITE